MTEPIQASPGSLASVQETVYILRKVRPLVVNRSVVDIVRRLARQLLPHEFQYESPTQEQARDIITELIMQLHRGSINHQGMAKIHDAFEGVVKASVRNNMSQSRVVAAVAGLITAAPSKGGKGKSQVADTDIKPYLSNPQLRITDLAVADALSENYLSDIDAPITTSTSRDVARAFNQKAFSNYSELLDWLDEYMSSHPGFEHFDRRPGGKKTKHRR